ncbi:uncharacterized protein H6S33_009258 [Morchella sextelata]|uniref:uncharacterized protein n=1 Tax=Morchella sextelata TaxID=1174677 RepID=UPI001D042B89|nr:uncharacterized protein H6S33_009258 [Morchella sextelata]KAH0612878.1 hypothetical protein H6S33_009258 [Morchella sextelata]
MRCLSIVRLQSVGYQLLIWPTKTRTAAKTLFWAKRKPGCPWRKKDLQVKPEGRHPKVGCTTLSVLGSDRRRLLSLRTGLRIADVVEVHPTQVSDVSPRFATDTSGAVRRRQLGGIVESLFLVWEAAASIEIPFHPSIENFIEIDIFRTSVTFQFIIPREDGDRDGRWGRGRGREDEG